jgi:asparagine synthase (glutamine-hydrolysing)
MPGICGIVAKGDSAELSSIVERMLGVMVTAGEVPNLCLHSQLNCSAGWVTPSESSSAQLPIWNEAKDVCVIFSGEPFTDNEVTPQDSFSGIDGGRFLDRYEKEGMEVLANLNGYFSGLLIDLRARRVLLFNDRYGLNRIYYHETPEGLFFSSQAKSLLKVLPHLRHLDGGGVSEWLSCGCVLQNRTLFREILLLPGASAWEISFDGRINKRTYFNKARWESLPTLPLKEYSARLEDVFPRAVSRSFRGNKTIGMSLTGGVDGRMIMAWSPKLPGELPCYTFNGPVRDCADVEIAREIASVCGQPHKTIAIGNEFFAEFPALAEQSIYISDGAMDVTGAAELYVNRIARDIAPIRMTGNYGSEILRRHVAFKPVPLPEDIFASDVVSQSREAAHTYTRERDTHPLSFIAFKQVPWHHYSRLAVEQSQLTVRSPFLDNELVELAFQAPEETSHNPNFLLRVIAAGNVKLGLIPTDRGLTFPPRQFVTQLRKSWAEFAAKAEYAFDYGMPQWLARLNHLAGPLRVERFFLGRQKFCHFRSWYSRPLSRYAKEMIFDPRTLSRPYLNRAALESNVLAHLSGRKNFTTAIHKIISLELIQRLLIERG